MTSTDSYNPRNLQSLFGYGRAAHVRSGGICQLCGCGRSPNIDFDLWRQFTIEHLIGRGDGGYPDRIGAAVSLKLEESAPPEVQRQLSRDIHEANIVTACQFCNSTTSRDRASVTMEELIRSGPDDPATLYESIVEQLQAILDRKRSIVTWKLEATRQAFENEIRPELERRRAEEPRLLRSWAMEGLDVAETSPHSSSVEGKRDGMDTL